MTESRIALGIVGVSASYGWGMRAHLPALFPLELPLPALR